MLQWLLLTVLCSVAAVIVAVPFIRRLDVPRDKSEGDAKSAAEVAAAGRAHQLSALEVQRLAVSLAGVVVLGSVGLYALTGNPNLELSAPGRTAAPAAAPDTGSDATSDLRKYAENIPEPAVAAATINTGGKADAQDPQAVAGVDEMIERLATRLKQSPGDANGWRMLGWSYFNTQRFAESADAYAKAIELQPEVAALKTARGEAMVRAAKDAVKPEAMALFDEALKADPKDPRARYFKGLAKEQAGDKKGAVEDWIAVLKDSAPAEPWWAELRTRTAELGKELGADLSALPPEPAGAASGGILARLQKEGAGGDGQAALPQADRGPSADDVRSAEGMADGDRQAMIRAMVDRLAERLEKSPRDADGWIKLIRSRSVLGEADKAKAALQKAWDAFADTPAEQERIAAEAKGLGVER